MIEWICQQMSDWWFCNDRYILSTMCASKRVRTNSDQFFGDRWIVYSFTNSWCEVFRTLFKAHIVSYYLYEYPSVFYSYTVPFLILYKIHMYLYFQLSIHRFIYLSIYYICLYVCLSICLSIGLSSCLFICLYICLYVCLSICLSIGLLSCLFVCLYKCLYLSASLSFYPAVYISIFLWWMYCYFEIWIPNSIIKVI